MAGVRPPAGMDGADLSPLFDGDGLPERPYAYGGYFNHLYVRNGGWSYGAEQRDVEQEMHAWLLERIGGLPPYYEGEAVERVKR